MSVYTVKFSGGRRPDYWVVTTGPDGQEYPVSMTTKSSAQAERWRTELERAYTANQVRRAAVKGRRSR